MCAFALTTNVTRLWFISFLNIHRDSQMPQLLVDMFRESKNLATWHIIIAISRETRMIDHFRDVTRINSMKYIPNVKKSEEIYPDMGMVIHS